MTEDTPRIPEIIRVEVLSVKPDDVIICTVRGRVQIDGAEYLKKTLKERFGIENRILVVEDDLKFQVLGKADAESIK